MNYRQQTQQVEVLLSSPEDLYQAIFEEAAEGIFVADRYGRYIAVNPQGSRMLGYTQDELRQLTIQDVITPEDWVRTPLLLSNLQPGNPLLQERRLRCRDGRLLWAEVKLQRLADDRLLAFVRDITERKQTAPAPDTTEQKVTDKALQERAEELRLLTETMPAIVWSTTEPCAIEFFSTRLLELTGMTREQIVNEGWRTFCHPDDWLQMVAASHQSQTTGAPYDVTHRIRTADGQYRWQRSRALPQRTAAGQIVRWYGITDDIHELHTAEEALRAEKERLNKIAATIPGVIYVFRQQIDQTLTLLYISPGATMFMGFEPDATVQKVSALFAAVHPDDRARIYAIMAESAQTLRAQNVEYRKLLPDGEVRWMESIAVPEREPDGSVLWYGFISDITERKRGEEALRQSEARFTKAFHASPVALSITRLRDRCFIDVNESFLRLYGYARAEIIGQRLPDLQLFTSPDDQTEITQVLRTQGTIHNYELATRTKAGALLHVLISAEKVELDGELHLLVTTFNITDRKRAEERLKLALATAQMGVWDWEPEADKLFWSPECYTIFGVENFDGTRKAFADFVPREDVAQVMAVFDEAIVNRRVYSHEFRIIRPDGEERWVYNHGRASYDKSGNPIRVTGIVQDTTEQKRAEDAQAYLEKQLRQAQKMETVGRLAGGIAHDFNNLLTVIQGYSDLLLTKIALDSPLRHRLEQIQKAGQRAAALTGQLLAFSRQQMLAPVILDLNNLVANLQNMLERLIGEDITLNVVLYPGLWSVTADPNQLEQVIMNLVINARDAMPTGGQLTIETANVQRHKLYTKQSLPDNRLPPFQSDTLTGPCVLLAVTDTGCGMDAQTQTHMFEPFFTTKEPGKGTGLGLATVYGIVKQSGGDVTVDSEVGYGSTFRIYLPANVTAPRQQSLSLMQVFPGRGHETILLVEDEELVRQLAQAALEDKGYTILEARDAHAALALSEQYAGSIDMVMTDVVMPYMSGRELVEHLIAQRPALKVLFTSGYTDDAVVRHGLLTAEVEFLPKPFSPGALALKVREVLDKHP